MAGMRHMTGLDKNFDYQLGTSEYHLKQNSLRIITAGLAHLMILGLSF